MKWKKVLTQLVNHPELHSQFLNTLSMMEYIGARKIMKSQPESTVSKDVLAHMVEEIRHAQLFKKITLKSNPQLTTYSDEHVLAGPEGRHYLQAIDRGVEERLGPGRPWINYLLSTLIIEERANSIYPFYESLLEPLGFGGVIRTILRDEENHLEDIQTELADKNALSDRELASLREIEQRAFDGIIDAIEVSLQDASKAPSVRQVTPELGL